MQNLNPETLMLIDDEFTTGKTCLNFIESLLNTVLGSQIKTINLICLTNWMSEKNKRKILSKSKTIGFWELRFNFYFHCFNGECYFDTNTMIPKFDIHKFSGNHKAKDDIIQMQYYQSKIRCLL